MQTQEYAADFINRLCNNPEMYRQHLADQWIEFLKTINDYDFFKQHMKEIFQLKNEGKIHSGYVQRLYEPISSTIPLYVKMDEEAKKMIDQPITTTVKLAWGGIVLVGISITIFLSQC